MANRRSLIWGCLLVALVLCVRVGASNPAWPPDPTDNVPLCTAPEGQNRPRSVSDGAWGAIVAWQDYRNNHWDVFAQRVDARGSVLWATDGVPVCTLGGDQRVPEMVADPIGGAIVVWEDDRPDSGGVYAQRIGAGGASAWTADGVKVCELSEFQYDVNVVSDGTGGAIAAWTDRRGGNRAIFAQRVDRSGDPLWDESGVAVCTSGADHFEPHLVSDGSGGAIVAWKDDRGATVKIYAQRVSGAGDVRWHPGGVALTDTTVWQDWLRTCTDGAGGAMVFFQDARDLTSHVYAQRLAPDGSRLWGVNGAAVCTASGGQQEPRPIPDGAGGAIVAWYDARAGSADIYAQRVDASGAGLWTAAGIPLCTETTSDQYQPRLVSDGAGGAIAVWRDWRNEVIRTDIYAQRIDASGSTHWTADGVPVCTATRNQLGPAPVPDGRGGAIVAWTDERSAENDIYAQRLGPDGSLGAPPSGGRVPRPSGVALSANIPNPFNPGTLIRYRLSRSGPVELSVFDASGRLIRTLIEGPASAGEGNAYWDGTDPAGRAVSSGVYFVRLQATEGVATRKITLIK